MLKINLLPAGSGRGVGSPIEQLHRTPLAWVIAGAIVLLPLLLLVPVGILGQQLRQLTQKVQALEPKKVAVDQLQEFLKRLHAQEAAFRGLEREQRDLWAARLNTLSDLTPEGVWYTELSLDQVGGLVIQGSAMSQVGPEMINVTRLVQDLKEDQAFSSAFKMIQIESIKRVQEGEFDLVQFTLTCTLAEPPS